MEANKNLDIMVVEIEEMKIIKMRDCMRNITCMIKMETKIL